VTYADTGRNIST